MNPLDPNKEQRVWSRVMCAQTIPMQKPQVQPREAVPCTSITEEELLELICGELKGCATYRYLACKLCGCAKQMLMKMAEDEACHAKMLGALYFLQSGRKACLDPQKPACVTCINETLRQLYAQELENEKRYQCLAGRAGEQACTMKKIAEDECRHAQMIYCILQNTL